MMFQHGRGLEYVPIAAIYCFFLWLAGKNRNKSLWQKAEINKRHFLTHQQMGVPEMPYINEAGVHRLDGTVMSLCNYYREYIHYHRQIDAEKEKIANICQVAACFLLVLVFSLVFLVSKL